MDAIITVDSDQNVILYNKAAERIFGWPTREMLGQPLTRLIPQRHRDAHGQRQCGKQEHGAEQAHQQVVWKHTVEGAAWRGAPQAALHRHGHCQEQHQRCGQGQ